MELVSTERVDAIIAKDGDVLVSDNYIKVLVEESNNHLKRSWEKIEKLRSAISKL